MRKFVENIVLSISELFDRISLLWREDEEFRIFSGWLYFMLIVILGAIILSTIHRFDLPLFISILKGDIEESAAPKWYPIMIVVGIVYAVMILSFFDTVGSIGSKIRFTTFHEIVFMTFLIFTTILIFSKIYEVTGLEYSGGGDVQSDRFNIDFLYFTIVTWTTLGFGDILPTQASKVVVIVNVSLGVIMNTAFIASVVSYAVNAKADRVD